MVEELAEALDHRERFVNLLKTFQDRKGAYKYREALSEMASQGKVSLIIDFDDLISFDAELASELKDKPNDIIPKANAAVGDAMRVENMMYASKVKAFKARFRGLDEHVPLRSLKSLHMGRLIMLQGIITRQSNVKQQLKMGVFQCPRCNEKMVREQTGAAMNMPSECENPDCGRKGFFRLISEESTFVDFQTIYLQEKPEELPPGQIPRSIEIMLTGDLVDISRAGDRISLVGILGTKQEYTSRGFKLSTFSTSVDANYVEISEKEAEGVTISTEDEKSIKDLSQDPNLFKKIIGSVAPSIYGYEEIKEAIAYQLAGGVAKIMPDGIKIRGDVNILLVGDPGTAKSQMLQYIARIAPRGVYTSGKGSTAAGLTATVARDKNTNEFFLEAGALVLGDKGIACLHPSSMVMIDGSIVPIVKLANNLSFTPIVTKNGISEIASLGSSTVSLDTNSLEVNWHRATRLRRRWYAGDLIELHMRSGFTTRVTPEHMLLDGNMLEWKEAHKLKEGDYVVAPLTIPSPQNSGNVFLWDVLPEDCTVSLTKLEKDKLKILLEAKYGDLSSASRSLGIERILKYYHGRLQPSLKELRKITNELGVEKEWKETSHTYSNSPILVTRLTPELAYICGFIYGDGYVRISKRRSTIVLRQSPKNRDLIERFEKCWNSCFSPLRLRPPRESVSKIRGKQVKSVSIEWSVSRRILGHIYEHMTQENLSNLISLPGPLLKAFIAGLMDSDGCLSKKTSFKEDTAYKTWNVILEVSRDKQANLNLLLALRRLGCIGSYRGLHGGVGVIVVSSRRDVSILWEALSNYSLKMQRLAPLQRLHNISGISEKLPKGPISGLFSDIFGEAKRTDLIEKGIWSTVYEYTHELRQPSVGQVLKIVEKTPLLSVGQRENLERVLRRDYFLDEVVGVKQENYEGYVYDLMMTDEPHNYISDGIFSHNCIDEIDKMRAEDRSAIHEAMEQQTISIAKAGIVVQLNARCSILAAANPAFGRYVLQRTIAENIQELPITILSRFDLIFTLLDRPEEAKDRSMTEHILKLHRGIRDEKSSLIPPLLLKKYVFYARKNISPKLTDAASEKIEEFFLGMRSKGQDADSPVPITMRQLEAVIRLSEARAKLALRNEVTKEDVEQVVRLVTSYLMQVGIDQSTGKLDIDTLMVGRPKSASDKMQEVFDILIKMERENDGGPIKREQFLERADVEGVGRNFAERTIGSWLTDGVIYEPKPGFIKKT
jgi:replicative DNA helicase Mcm